MDEKSSSVLRKKNAKISLKKLNLQPPYNLVEAAITMLPKATVACRVCGCVEKLYDNKKIGNVHEKITTTTATTLLEKKLCVGQKIKIVMEWAVDGSRGQGVESWILT